MKPIREECALIINGASKNEIIATLRLKDWSGIYDIEINQMVKHIQNNTLDNLPDKSLCYH